MALSLSECSNKTSETKEDIMEIYLTSLKRKVERDGDNETNKSHQKAKTRKYDEPYVALGFTVIQWETRKDQCVYRVLKC